MRGRTAFGTIVTVFLLASVGAVFFDNAIARTNEAERNLLQPSDLMKEKADVSSSRVSEDSAMILVDPRDNVFYSWEKRVNNMIMINVTVANMTRLFGLSLTLYFNNSLVTCTGFIENLFHSVTPPSSWDNIWQIKKKINSSNGYIEYACTYLDANRAFSDGYAPINITESEYLEGKLAAATLTFSITKMPPPNGHVGCPLHLTAVQPTDVAGNVILIDLVDGHYELISPTGDLNDDRIIDVYDAVLFAKAFGSIPTDSDWNPKSDLNSDDIVDIYDAILLALNFGNQTT